MFKRLRERIAEEATKFPVAQLGNNSGRILPESENKPTDANSTEDLITLSDSSSVVVPHTSPQQFSIGEEEEGSLSEHSTPQKKQNTSSDASGIFSSNSGGVDHLSFGQEYHPSKKTLYVPQSDIESEREDPPTLNLDSISKDQLMAAIQSLKAKSYKYKNKYVEVVKNFKELRDEKLKIENTLIENQDKGLRRIGELREQCQLEQKAKAHLEENLRLLLEEKDSRICVLETQINLLKEGGKSNSSKTLVEECDSQLSDGCDTRSEDSATSVSNDVSVLQEKVDRLQHQINQDKKTITAQKDQISLLRKQNENLSQELEEKVNRLNNIEDDQARLKSEHDSVLKDMQERLKELEKQEEENIMSMAETKRNMHVELELKEKQLNKAEEESKLFQAAAEKEKKMISELKKQHEQKVKQLEHQLEITEKTLEEEKQSLLHELGQGKTAAINLMQQECTKKIAATEDEWKAKFEALQSFNEKSSQTQVQDLNNSLNKSEEKNKQMEHRIQELNSLVSVLEKENASLKNSIEKLESESLEADHNEGLKDLKDKLQNTEKMYKNQIEEMKVKLNQLETENSRLLSEKENLLIVQNQFKEVKSSKEKIQSELKSKEQQLKLLKENLETSNREQAENIKDKENLILKLRTNLESASKECEENVEELHKKIKKLEVEREQLMLQAQERVSTTEAKCREDIKLVQEKCEKSLLENSELEKKICIGEVNQAASNEEILHLKGELSNLKQKLAETENNKLSAVSELSHKLEKLQEENKQLLHNSDLVEELKAEKDELKAEKDELKAEKDELKAEKDELKAEKDELKAEKDELKAEKDELNEKLKTAIIQDNKISALEAERNSLKQENEELSKELNNLKIAVVGTNDSTSNEEIKKLISEIENLKSEMVSLQSSSKTEKDSFLLEKEKLSNQIKQLESCVSDPQNASVQDYLENIKRDYEMAIKEKDDDMLCKLKQLVKDFSIQMDVKDKDSEQMINELTEKNQLLEERLQREYADLRQELFEKECALEEMRDSYEETLQEKNLKITEQAHVLKNLASKENISESAHGITEPSDWDDTWVVPDEVVDNSSPNHNAKKCDEHVQQIEELQEELSKCNSEIKELKVLLRLSPPETMVNNNNSRDSLHSIPEPTEFEYLKNIIYEYMMGKEPVTLAKVIAAVLRFNEVQTQQVMRREEARHPTK